MTTLKGFTSTTENQELHSLLVDVGLIFYSGFRDYREYLKTLFYKPASIKMNRFIRQLHDMSDEQIEMTLQKL